MSDFCDWFLNSSYQGYAMFASRLGSSPCWPCQWVLRRLESKARGPCIHIDLVSGELCCSWCELGCLIFSILVWKFAGVVLCPQWCVCQTLLRFVAWLGSVTPSASAHFWGSTMLNLCTFCGTPSWMCFSVRIIALQDSQSRCWLLLQSFSYPPMRTSWHCSRSSEVRDLCDECS